MSTTRTIRIQDNGLTRTIVRPTGVPGAPGAPGPPGSMTGPSSATANAIPLFDGTTGALLKDSTVLLSALATAAALTAGLAGKQDVAAGKGLSTNDFTNILKAKLDALGTATYRGSYPSLADLQAAYPAGDAGDWAHVEVTGQVLKLYHWDSVNESWQIGVDLSGKVDKVTGKGLSTNDFTDAYLALLSTAVQTSTFEAAFDGLDTAIATFSAHVAALYNPHPGTYAGIRIEDGVTTMNVASASGIVPITVFNTSQGVNDASNDCTSDKTNNRVAVTRPGRYKIDWSLSLFSDTNNVGVVATPMVNGAALGSGKASTRLASLTDVHCLSGTSIADIPSVSGTEGHIKLGFSHTHGGAVGLTPVFAGMVVTRLGDSA